MPSEKLCVMYTDVVTKKPRVNAKFYVFITLLLVVALVTFFTGVALLFSQHDCDERTRHVNLSPIENGYIADLDHYCTLSQEAKYIGLNTLLRDCQQLFFKYFPHEQLMEVSQSKQIAYATAKRFKVFLPSPENLKELSDEVNAMLSRVEKVTPKLDEMKPRETKTLDEIKIFLKQYFAGFYSTDFYSGDWMFGPNFFCWHRVCKLGEEIQTLLANFRPKTKDDLIFLITTFLDYEKVFQQYEKNMRLGIDAGFVQSKSSCVAGKNAFKSMYSKIITLGKHGGTKEERRFARLFTKNFYSEFSKREARKWRREYQRSHIQTLYDALVEGFSAPLIKFYKFLSEEYIRHCPPDDIASGLSQLPLSYIYVDGKPKSIATQKLPLENTPLNGRYVYERILSRFTTTDISPEKIYEEGLKQTDLMYSKMVKLAMKLTGEKDEQVAILKMKNMTQQDDQWHGETSFPENESDEQAYSKCVDDKSAEIHCPKRSKSMKKWTRYIYRILSMIHPKLCDAFHFAGEKNSVPNCPITMEINYNPSSAVVYFQRSDRNCSRPTKFGLPFFMNRYGPRFQEWSLIGHEARPGHHFQNQGSMELFRDPCETELESFFHTRSYMSAYIEGWAMYAENPVLSDDIRLYDENLFQKFGMYKMQIWRALRLVVDTGLHYRNESREWVINQFKKYVWDSSDLVEKEVTRYMSAPGQATAYMIGRLAIMKARAKSLDRLGILFDLKDFHYQVLSLGQVSLGYFEEYMDKYVDCIERPDKKYCQYYNTPISQIPRGKRRRWMSKDTLTSANRHYA